MGAGITHCRRPRSSDWRCGESAKFSTCENYNSDGGDLTGGKWGPWLMVVQVSFLKCDRYSKVLLSQLMTSSFKGNKLYSLLFRFTEQKARLVWGTEFLFYSEPTGNHWTLTATSQAVSSGESKFPALLYSLFPLSTPHPEKMFRHLALKENGHLGGKKKKKTSLQMKRSDLKLETRDSKRKILCSIYIWSPNNVILTEYRHFPR